MNRRGLKLKWFVRRFGKSERDPKQRWQNSWPACLGLMLLTLTIAFFFTREYVLLRNAQIEEASFTLLRAEHYHRPDRGMDVDKLYLYSVDGTKYIVEQSNISVSEIKACLEVLREGMRIDVLTANDGVRELTADGEVLLSRETTAERAGRTTVLAIVMGILMFAGSIVMALRTTALYIKKRKGWNF